MSSRDYGLGMKMEEIPAVFDVQVLAQLLQCSVSTARTYMNRPGFPVWKITKRRHKIYREQFLRWVEGETGFEAYDEVSQLATTRSAN